MQRPRHNLRGAASVARLLRDGQPRDIRSSSPRITVSSTRNKASSTRNKVRLMRHSQVNLTLHSRGNLIPPGASLIRSNMAAQLSKVPVRTRQADKPLLADASIGLGRANRRLARLRAVRQLVRE